MPGIVVGEPIARPLSDDLRADPGRSGIGEAVTKGDRLVVFGRSQWPAHDHLAIDRYPEVEVFTARGRRHRGAKADSRVGSGYKRIALEFDDPVVVGFGDSAVYEVDGGGRLERREAGGEEFQVPIVRFSEAVGLLIGEDVDLTYGRGQAGGFRDRIVEGAKQVDRRARREIFHRRRRPESPPCPLA